MGIVAFDTISLDHDAVGALRFFRQESFVALDANLLRIFGKELPVRRGMGVVTFGAFALFYRGVDKGAFQLILERFMAVQTEFSLCARLQPERIL